MNTKLKRISLLSPIQGLYISMTGAQIPEASSPSMINIEYHKGTLRRSRLMTSFSDDALSGRVLLIDQYAKWSGGNWLVCITDNKFYKWDVANKTWDIIGDYSGTSGRFVSSDIINDWFIFTDGENNVKKYDGSSYGDLGGLPTLNIQSCLVKGFWSHCILGYTIESGNLCPQRIRWSDTGNPEVWDSGNAGFVDIADTPDWIVNIMPLLDRLYIFKERSIWEMFYIGYPNMFHVSPVIQGIGLAAPGTLESMGTYLMFLGHDAIYKFDGRNVEDISEPVRDLLYGVDSIVNPEALNKSVGLYIEELDEYWLCIPTGDSSYPDYILRYSVEKGTWWPREINNELICLGSWFRDTALTWVDLKGTWEEQSWTWGASTTMKAAAQTLIGIYDGSYGRIKIIEPTACDTGIVSAYETKDIVTDEAGRWTEFWVETKGIGNIKLYCSTDEGKSWNALASKPSTAEWNWLKWNFNIYGKQIRFKVEITSGDVECRRQVITMFERKYHSGLVKV